MVVLPVDLEDQPAQKAKVDQALLDHHHHHHQLHWHHQWRWHYLGHLDPMHCQCHSRVESHSVTVTGK